MAAEEPRPQVRTSGPIVLASRNDGKRREFEHLAAGALQLELLPEPAPAVEEDGDTYLANALKKARSATRFTGQPALADDSGLEVDALGGAPGIFSARFGGPELDDRGRVEHLLAELGDAAQRTARFRCVLVLADGDEWISADGALEGEIEREPRGGAGFGYDPVFVASGSGGRTLAEIGPQEKNRISHRATALRALLAQL